MLYFIHRDEVDEGELVASSVSCESYGSYTSLAKKVSCYRLVWFVQTADPNGQTSCYGLCSIPVGSNCINKLHRLIRLQLVSMTGKAMDCFNKLDISQNLFLMHITAIFWKIIDVNA